MRDVLAITKALADPNRLRILCALRTGELCVCQVIELLGLAPSTVSKHLSILHQARLVEGRKEGRWMYYRLPDREECTASVARALEWTLESLRNEPPIRADRRTLRAICCVPPEALCQAKRDQ